MKKAGVFVDGANLFYAQKKAGWKIDLSKLKKLLKKEAKILVFNYYAAIPAKWDNSYEATSNYLEKIKNTVQIKTKPLKYIRTGNTLVKKGDVDLEITLDVVRSLQKFDLVIVVSGDSDYVELRKYVLETKKEIIFLAFKENMAWEIKKGKYFFLNKLRQAIELNKKTPGFYPGRLLLDSLYQKKQVLSRTRKK